MPNRVLMHPPRLGIAAEITFLTSSPILDSGDVSSQFGVCGLQHIARLSRLGSRSRDQMAHHGYRNAPQRSLN